MQPTKCRSCGESQFHHDQLQAGLVNGEKTILSQSPGDGIVVRCSVCLACGIFTTYIDDASLTVLRALHPEFTRKDATQ